MREETSRDIDEIDTWAERVFGKRTPDTRQRRMRNGMQSQHGKREFDKLFKPETTRND